jgi:hypothetical protein
MDFGVENQPCRAIIAAVPLEERPQERPSRTNDINNSQPMKMLRLFPVALGMAAACALPPDTAKLPPRTEVVFDHPERFRDIRDKEHPTEKGQDAILRSIRDYLVSRTAPMIPEGYKLTIRFTDIDLAGDFEPWRGQQWDEVRIVKQLYPPALKFTYSVTDPSGKVVREGSENILDINFQLRVLLDTQDPLRYEKDILGDWARTNLRDLKKA